MSDRDQAERDVFRTGPVERRKATVDRIVMVVLAIVVLLVVLPLLAILTHLMVRAWPALSWSFLVKNPTNYMTAGGIWSPLIGTFYLVLFSLAIATPIGVLAGIYLNEYASDNWMTRIVNLAVVSLAGVPSIVHALFGVGAFVLFAGMGRSVLAASCTLAVMTLPVIITSTREALSAVPRSFREACWNMGASRWQTIRTIVLPNSISGILTGIILQVSRAAGETAPILFTGAVFYVAVPDTGLELVLSALRHLGSLHGPVLSPFILKTQVSGVPESAAIRHGGRAVRHRALGQSAVHRLPRLPAVAQEVVGAAQTMAVTHIAFDHVTARYGPKVALRDVTFEIMQREIFGIIGPSNSGKTTLLKCINRTIDFVPGATVEGDVRIDGQDVFRTPERVRTAAPDRHGLSAAGGTAAVGLRQRRLCAADGRRAQSRDAGCARRGMPAAGGAVGRSQGSHGHAGHQALRRPAAAADDRPGAVAPARRSSAWMSSPSPSIRSRR